MQEVIQKFSKMIDLMPTKTGRRSGSGKSFRSLSDKEYYMDVHGTIHRIHPKRDKSISSRQHRIMKRKAKLGVS